MVGNSRIFVAVLVLVASGCPRAKPEQPAGDRSRIRAFADSLPVISIAALGSEVFAAKPDGLYRASWESDELVRVGSKGELPQVHSLVSDEQQQVIWVVTERGLTRFDPATGTGSDLPDPPAKVSASLGELKAVADGEGGLFAGGDFGLLHFTAAGEWKPVGIADPVTAVVMDRAGTLWVGTKRGLRAFADGSVRAFGANEGVDLAHVTAASVGPTGLIVLGGSSAGEQRVVFRFDGSLRTYRSTAGHHFDGIAASDAVSVLAAGGKLYSLRPATVINPGKAEVIDFAPAPPPGQGPGLAAPVEAVRLDVRRLPRVTTIAAHGRRILVGTRDAGMASWLAGSGWQWARASELAREATLLTVACIDRSDCFIASGAGAWRWDGRDFRDPQVDGALAFVRHPDGGIYALVRAGPAIGFASLDGATWSRIDGLKVGLRGGPVDVTYARFAPGGLLWLGLSYRDKQGDLRPQGVALVDVALGAVSYHHASFDERAVKRGILPVPIGTTDVSFLGTDEIWLASSQGAVKVEGTDVVVFGEAEGLASEVLRGIACSSAGVVFVGSRRGVGIYDGDGWSYPKDLAIPVNDLRFGTTGKLWLATPKGLLSFDGATVRSFGVSNGLLEAEVDELELDHFGRLWLRSPRSFAVVDP